MKGLPLGQEPLHLRPARVLQAGLFAVQRLYRQPAAFWFFRHAPPTQAGRGTCARPNGGVVFDLGKGFKGMASVGHIRDLPKKLGVDMMTSHWEHTFGAKRVQEIVEKAGHLHHLVGTITAATREQSVGIGQVSQAVAALDRVTQENAALVEQNAGAAACLNERTLGLKAAVAGYQVSPA